MSIDPKSDDVDSRFTEFLADYFVECDEHLGIAKRSLLSLEQLLPQSRFDKALLDELFRSFHSLKGLSAMVGFHEAEQLGHHLESFLGTVRRNPAQLNLEGLEALMAGVVALEQLIAARRDATTPADVSLLLDRLASLIPTAREDRDAPANAPVPDEQQSLLTAKLRAGAHAWQFTFIPSPELSARGVDVTSVRKKLQELGEIIRSVPVVGEAGRIEFSFLVVTEASEDTVCTLKSDGLSCVRYPLENQTEGQEQTVDKKLLEEGPSTHLTPANVVRVDLHRLDELMRLVGDLVVSRARLDEGLRRLQIAGRAAEVRDLRETASMIERQLRELREAVMHVRMVPVREVFVRMQFVVRDLIRESGKQVSLRMSGEDTQIDKYVVERIMDPLLHLVRNAVSHGLESPDERRAAGKPPEGKINLRAKTVGETVVIEVEDDGRGIDGDSVIRQARARGIALPSTDANEATLLDILCVSGFSTREQVDRVSGRGIGMDVVRRTVEELGGSVALRTTPGRGTRFDIQLPLTVAITEALIVKIGNERYAVPQVAVREIIRIEPNTLTRIEKHELVRYRDGALPLLRLSQNLGTTAEREMQLYALVIGDGTQAVGLAVDRLLGLQEIVVRPLTDRLVQVPEVAGATELGDGQVVLILDTGSFVRGSNTNLGARSLATKPAINVRPQAGATHGA